MDAGKINIDAYLKRIKYNGDVNVSYKTLRDLHIAHALSVPFENLDVIWGKDLLLDKNSLFQKIVLNNRGGACCEINSLFAYLLEDMGFKVDWLMEEYFWMTQLYFRICTKC